MFKMIVTDINNKETNFWFWKLGIALLVIFFVTWFKKLQWLEIIFLQSNETFKTLEFWNYLPGSDTFCFLVFCFFDLGCIISFILICLFVTMFYQKSVWLISYKINFQTFLLTFWIILLCLLLCWYSCICIFYVGQNFSFSSILCLKFQYQIDLFSICLKFFLTLFLLVGSILIHNLCIIPTLWTRFNSYILFFSFFIFFLYLMVGLIELFTFLLCLEGVGLSILLLLGLRYDFAAAIRGAIMYYTVSALALSLFLFGLGFLYGGFHTLNLRALYYATHFFSFELFQHFEALWFGSIFLTLGFMLKLGLFPLHYWVVSTYEGMDWSLLWLFSIPFKLIFIFFMIRFYYSVFFVFACNWKPLFIYALIPSIAYGLVGAAFEPNLKRFLGYLSIQSNGMFLIGFFGEAFFATVATFLLYFVLYAFSLLILVSVFSYLFVNTFNQDDPAYFEYPASLLTYIQRIGLEFPHLIKYLVLALLSLAGVPPAPSFFLKYSLIKIFYTAGLFGMCLVVLVLSGLSLWYYLNIIKYAILGVRRQRLFSFFFFKSLPEATVNFNKDQLIFFPFWKYTDGLLIFCLSIIFGFPYVHLFFNIGLFFNLQFILIVQNCLIF